MSGSSGLERLPEHSREWRMFRARVSPGGPCGVWGAACRTVWTGGFAWHALWPYGFACRSLGERLSQCGWGLSRFDDELDAFSVWPYYVLREG